MNPITLLVPLESTITEGISTGSNDVTSAVGAAGGAVVMCLILVKVAKSAGALAAVLMAGIFGGFAWWLLKLDGLATIAQVWDATIKAWTATKPPA